MRVVQKSLGCGDAFSGVDRDAWCPDIERGAGDGRTRTEGARAAAVLRRVRLPGGPVTVRYDFNRFSRFPNMQPVGMYPIHIIVKNLRTTLLGTVDTDLDRTLAATRARTVPGVLNVEVEVMVAGDLARK